MDDKRLGVFPGISSKKIKETGLRFTNSVRLNMNSIAKEKGIPKAEAYREAVDDYIYKNIPK